MSFKEYMELQKQRRKPEVERRPKPLWEIKNDQLSLTKSIISDIVKGKQIISTGAGKFFFIIGTKFRELDNSICTTLVEQKIIRKSYRAYGKTYYKVAV